MEADVDICGVDSTRLGKLHAPLLCFCVHEDRVLVLVPYALSRTIFATCRIDVLQYSYSIKGYPIHTVIYLFLRLHVCTKVENVLAYWFLLDVSLISPSLTVVQKLSWLSAEVHVRGEHFCRGDEACALKLSAAFLSMMHLEIKQQTVNLVGTSGDGQVTAQVPVFHENSKRVTQTLKNSRLS